METPHATPEYPAHTHQHDPEQTPDEGESVERELAHYAFVREERDREVRLHFRDVPALDIARAFRAAGAGLISITGERITSATQEPVTRAVQAHMRHRRKGDTHAMGASVSGEVLMRYFYGLGEMVYTVNITVPSGVIGSIASIYPAARLPERELQDRLAMVFVSAEC